VAEYVSGSGDLDECNGRIGVTPEFPEGVYHYYLTDTLPFGQRCVKGTSIDGSSSGGENMNPVMCGNVPGGMPCCGDALCGGPETVDNCAIDCF
jgi:hypothetical protein